MGRQQARRRSSSSPWPDEKAETNRFEITIPHGASLILTHELEWPVSRPQRFCRRSDRPPVMPPFFAFRMMVGIGLLMIADRAVSARGCGGAAAVRRRAGISGRRSTPGGSASSPSSAGWIVTETGRQPWVAYGILRTADAVSPVPAQRGRRRSCCSCWSTASCSLGIYYINRLIAHGPRDPRDRAARARPSRPLSAPHARSRDEAISDSSARQRHGMLSAGHLGRAHRHRGRDVCDPRRLRSRHRHPVPVRRRASTSATR